MLLNLLINARQAMPGGGMVRLRLGLDATGRLAEISVADTGVGIAPADLRRIFEPFFSTKTEPDAAGQGGTGLGLAVCRDIVEAHHGRLRAESRLGQGSTFTIILPACPPPAAASDRARAGVSEVGRILPRMFPAACLGHEPRRFLHLPPALISHVMPSPSQNEG